MAKRKRVKHPPVFIVEWHDSRELASHWTDRHKVIDEAPGLYERCISTGFLLSQTKDFIVLALGLAPNDDVTNVIQIPMCNIAWSRRLMKPKGFKFVKDK